VTTQDLFETYVARLRSALSALTRNEREDIVDEIRANVNERISSWEMSLARC